MFGLCKNHLEIVDFVVLAGGHHSLTVQTSNSVSLAVGGDCDTVSNSVVHCFGSVLDTLSLGSEWDLGWVWDSPHPRLSISFFPRTFPHIHRFLDVLTPCSSDQIDVFCVCMEKLPCSLCDWGCLWNKIAVEIKEEKETENFPHPVSRPLGPHFLAH